MFSEEVVEPKKGGVWLESWKVERPIILTVEKEELFVGLAHNDVHLPKIHVNRLNPATRSAFNAVKSDYTFLD